MPASESKQKAGIHVFTGSRQRITFGGGMKTIDGNHYETTTQYITNSPKSSIPVVHSENATFWGRQSVDRRVENHGGNNQVNMDNSNGTIHGDANKADSEVAPRRHTDPLPSRGSSGSPGGETAPYSHDRPRSPVSEKYPPRDSLQNLTDASKQTSGRMNEDVLIKLLHEMNKKMDAMAEDIKVLKTKFEERERDLDNSNATNGKNQCIIS